MKRKITNVMFNNNGVRVYLVKEINSELKNSVKYKILNAKELQLDKNSNFVFFDNNQRIWFIYEAYVKNPFVILWREWKMVIVKTLIAIFLLLLRRFLD